MARPTIEPTQYSRDDGIVMMRLPSGNWMVRRNGSCFFFDKTRMNGDPWVFRAAKDLEDLESFGMSFGEAYRFLEVIPPEARAKAVKS
jgi:hypothetical protein